MKSAPKENTREESASHKLGQFTKKARMGRPNVETQLPYPPPPPPQVQPQPALSYPSQLNYPPPQGPQQLYNYHPGNYVPQATNNLPQVSTGVAPSSLQYQLGSPAAIVKNGYATTISSSQQPSFQNNAGIGVLPSQMPLQAATQQPQQIIIGGAPWTTGLFDCTEDPQNAFITAVMPCITFGQIADVLDNGHTTCATSGIMYPTAPCLMSRPYRGKLRQRFGLVEAPYSDRIVHSMFEHCALCQEYRELKNRGIDPALGYQGNFNKQPNEQKLTTMDPPNFQTMK